MSTTFSIACRDCKEHLWIAQGHRDGSFGHVYHTPEYAKAHYDFYIKHRGHALVFDENCESFIGDFKEVGPGAEEET